MRISISDPSRAKTAAKALARLSPAAKLATVHEALARAVGYRDWHELSASALTTTPATEAEGLFGIILRLSEALDLDPGDVQYTLDKAGLLTTAPLSLEAHFGLCSAIWRRRFGPPGRGKPGTVVKVKAHGRIQPAYLLQAGRPTFLLFDTGPGSRADFEVITPRTPLPDYVPSHLWLPYGYWTLADGSEVIFSRDYFPLWRMTTDYVERLDPWLWIKDIATTHHFAGSKVEVWHSGSAQQAALRHLAKRRIHALPRLVSIMPYLLGSNVEKISPGVARLHAVRGHETAVPTYAQLNARLDLD